MQKIQAFKKLLSSSKKIVITTHQKPDADALGSSLGLAGILEKMGHQTTVIAPTDYPSFLNWMQGNDDVIVFTQEKEQEINEIIQDAEVVFCLDFSSLHRINQLGALIEKSSAVKVLIDHHLDPDDFADYVCWDVKAAATAELIFKLFDQLDLIHLVDEGIGEALYAGIMTDTGSFKHSNTTKSVHMVTARLIEMGVDTAKVARLIYDDNSLNRLRFVGFALNQRLKLMKEYRTAYFAITAADLEKFHSQTGDTEGLVNYALSLRGVVFAAIIIDRGELVKLSLRSVGDFAVNDLANQYFEGGGHKNAAGGKSNLSLEETVAKFEALLPQYKEQLNAKIQKINADA